MVRKNRYSRYRSASYSRWGTGTDWNRYHHSRRQNVSGRFGGIDKDVEAIFLGLSQADLHKLLASYGARYGKSAEAYARATYPKWKSGAVLLSGQTALRLLELVPPLLSAEQRYELVRKLRSHYTSRERIFVQTNPIDWRGAVLPAVERIVARARFQNLPVAVLQNATWLTSDDAVAAQALLARVEEEESRVRTSLLAEEFRRIEYLMSEMDGKQKAITHTITLPHGDIQVRITDPRARTGCLLAVAVFLCRGTWL